MVAPECPYCGRDAVLIRNSSEVYHGRDFGPVWICRSCAAWVGCHKNSKDFAPLGRMANATLRKARVDAHEQFDTLWSKKVRRGCSRKEARNAAYEWLAGQMGITKQACHIGKMNEEQCGKVVDICRPYAERIRREYVEKG